jgi:hypothetical protein
MADLKIKQFLTTFSKIVNMFEPTVAPATSGMTLAQAHENLFQHRATHVFIDKLCNGGGVPGLRYKYEKPVVAGDTAKYGMYLEVNAGMGPKMIINGFTIETINTNTSWGLDKPSTNNSLIQLSYTKDFNGFNVTGFIHDQGVKDKLKDIVELCDADFGIETLESYEYMTLIT